MSAHSALINVMTAAAEKAARPLVRDFTELSALQASSKPLDHFLKLAKEKATQNLTDALSTARHDFGIKCYGEVLKASSHPNGAYWFITPICGSQNYLHAIPTWAIQITCIEKGEAVASVVFAPMVDELYVASKGAGAFLNTQRLRASRRQDLNHQAMIGLLPVSDPAKPEFKTHHTQMTQLMQLRVNVRTLGSPALTYCYVAAGRMDAAFGYAVNREVAMAAALFTTESGGFNANKIDTGLKQVMIGNDKMLNALKKQLAS